MSQKEFLTNVNYTNDLLQQLERNLKWLEDINQASTLQSLCETTDQIFNQLGFNKFWLWGSVGDSLASISELGLLNIPSKTLEECATLDDFTTNNPWLMFNEFQHVMTWRTDDLEKMAATEDARAICDIARRHEHLLGIKIPVYDTKKQVAMQLDISTHEKYEYPTETSSVSIMAQVVIDRYFALVHSQEDQMLNEHEHLAFKHMNDPHALSILSAKLGMEETAAHALMQHTQKKQRSLEISQAIAKYGRGVVIPSPAALT